MDANTCRICGADTSKDKLHHWQHAPTWELRNMVRALEMLPWLNTPDDDERHDYAKAELKRRNKRQQVYQED